MSSWQKAIAASAGRKAASLLHAGRSLIFSCIVQLGFEYLRLKDLPSNGSVMASTWSYYTCCQSWGTPRAAEISAIEAVCACDPALFGFQPRGCALFPDPELHGSSLLQGKIKLQKTPNQCANGKRSKKQIVNQKHVSLSSFSGVGNNVEKDVVR